MVMVVRMIAVAAIDGGGHDIDDDDNNDSMYLYFVEMPYEQR